METRRLNRLKREQQLVEKEKEILHLHTIDPDAFTWVIDFEGPQESLYQGEKMTYDNKPPVQVPRELCELTSPSNHQR